MRKLMLGLMMAFAATAFAVNAAMAWELCDATGRIVITQLKTDDDAGPICLDAAAPLMLGPGTLSWNGGVGVYNGDVTTKLDVMHNGKEGFSPAVVFDVAEGGDLTLAGKFDNPSGAFIKTGKGTLRIPGGAGTNITLAATGGYVDALCLQALKFNANGDTPTKGYSGFCLAGGTLVLGEKGGTFEINGSASDVMIGTMTKDPVLDAGEQEDGNGVLEVRGGEVNINNWLGVGAKCGFATTTPNYVPESGIRVYGGTLRAKASFSMGRNKNVVPQKDAGGNYIPQRTKTFVEVHGGEFQIWESYRFSPCDDAGADARILVDGGRLFLRGSLKDGTPTTSAGIKFGNCSDGANETPSHADITIRDSGILESTDNYIVNARKNVTVDFKVLDGGTARWNRLYKGSTKAGARFDVLFDGGVAEQRYASYPDWVKADLDSFRVGTRGMTFTIGDSTGDRNVRNTINKTLTATNTHPDEVAQGVTILGGKGDRFAGFRFAVPQAWEGPTTIGRFGICELTGTGEFPLLSPVTIEPTGKLVATNQPQTFASLAIGRAGTSGLATLGLAVDQLPLTANAFSRDAQAALAVELYATAGDVAPLSTAGTYTLVKVPAAYKTTLEGLAVSCANPAADTGYAFAVKENGDFAELRVTVLVMSEDYTRVEGIIVPNGAYIDTLYKPNQDTHVVMDVTVQGATEYWFGCWDEDYNDGAFAFGNDGTGIYSGYGNQGGTFGSVVAAGRHRVELDGNTVKVDGVGCHSFTNESFALANNLYLFAQNRKGKVGVAGSQNTIVCQECTISENGTLKRDFLPCVRTADGAVGLFDTVEKQFFENRGNGTFGVPDGTFCTVTVGNLSGMTAAYTFGDGIRTNAVDGTSFGVPRGAPDVKVIFTADPGYFFADGVLAAEVLVGRVDADCTVTAPEVQMSEIETFGRGWYVTVTDGVYVDTLFRPDSNTRVEMDVDVGDAQEYWFGCWTNNWDNGAFALGNDVNNEVYCGYGSGRTTCGGISGLIPPGRVTVALEKGVVYTNDVVWSAAHADSNTVFALNYNLYLFAQNRKGVTYPGWEQDRIICYGCRIWTNDVNGAAVPVRNFVPARTKDDQQIVGLYDTVTGRFFAPRDGTLTLAVSGRLTTAPWQQNVYTNRFTIFCETAEVVPGLSLQYGSGFGQSVEMTCVPGDSDGTTPHYIYKGRVNLDSVGGVTGSLVSYRIVADGAVLKCPDGSDAEGSVWVWRDVPNERLTVALWSDNQVGAKVGDYDLDRFAYVKAAFGRMVAHEVDFGISTGDMTTSGSYADQTRPCILDGSGILGRVRPYYVCFGNHDDYVAPDEMNKRYFETGSLDEPAYGTSERGAYYFYRGNVLFIFLHWPHDNQQGDYSVYRTWLQDLLATPRAKQAKFRLLFSHEPMFLEVRSEGSEGRNYDTSLYDTAVAGGVDMVVSGHMHGYERTVTDKGLVQLVNGGMGSLDHKEHVVNNYGDWTKMGGHRNIPYLWARQSAWKEPTLCGYFPVNMGCITSYCEMKIDGGELNVQAHGFCANGDYIGVFDDFTLVSKTDRTPPTPRRAVTAACADPSSFDTFVNTPVTNAKWKEYKDAVDEDFTYATADASKPVVNVSKDEITRFCAWLNNGASGVSYRLPTETELRAKRTNLAGAVTEWTSTVDKETGWCRILGGNALASNTVWTATGDKPAIASSACHANYLGFRLVKESGTEVVVTIRDWTGRKVQTVRGVTTTGTFALDVADYFNATVDYVTAFDGGTVSAAPSTDVVSGSVVTWTDISRRLETEVFVQPRVPYKNFAQYNMGDPWIVKDPAANVWYVTSTMENDGLSVRQTTTFPTNRFGSSKTYRLKDHSEFGNYKYYIWAPEIHCIQGRWYAYLSASSNSGSSNYERPFVLKLPDGLTPYTSNGWEFGAKLVTPGGDRWAIDGTILDDTANGGKLYYVWSGWPSTANGVQNLYLAEMATPTSFASGAARILISTPTESWETLTKSPCKVNEGPAVLRHGDAVHIVYSCNGCWTDDYSLALLTCTDGNFANPASWKKSSSRIFVSRPGAYGPGHCSFTRTADGQDMIVYHAKNVSGHSSDYYNYRDIRMQPIAWHGDTPVLGVPRPYDDTLTSDPLDLNADYYKEGPGAQSVSITPGEPLVFDTAEEATNAMKTAMFAPSDEVAAVFGSDADAKSAYCAKFGFAVLPTSGGQWAVVAGLKPEAWSNVVESAQAATRQIPVADLAALELGVPTDVTVTNCVPGFYYTIYGGSAVTNLRAFVSEKSRNVLCEPGKPVKFSEVVKPSAASGFFAIGVGATRIASDNVPYDTADFVRNVAREVGGGLYLGDDEIELDQGFVVIKGTDVRFVGNTAGELSDAW